MINIVEKKSNKSPGMTSLYVSFKYNEDILNVVKSCDGAVYHKKDKMWEIPCSELSKIIDGANLFDDIQIDLLKDKQVKEKEIKLDIKKFKTKPFQYQLEGIEYGLTHNKWLLLDQPGLGKTLQILYIAQLLKEQGKIEHCLIICGVNTLKTNWKKEIQKHTNLSCKILGERKRIRSGKTYFGGMKERLGDLKSELNEFFIITNIETLRENDIIKEINKGKNKFDMIVIDEAHTVKNNTSQQGKNFLKLNNAAYMIAATGTPLVNTPLDAYVPLKWIGLEHCSNSTFKYYYVRYGGMFNNEVIGYRHLDVLKDELSKCSLRRTKDLLELPPKNIIHELVDMKDDQRNFYDNIVDGVIDNIDKVTISPDSIFSTLIRLRQATACPSILTTENISSAKIERCIDLVEQIVSNEEKVVVYSTFKETLNILLSQLSQYNPLLCTGDISDVVISENVDKFQSDDRYKVILATWSKMGTGITLTASSNIIFIDCAWTAASNEQAEDRCHRIGSNKPVFIYYLWANNTVDLKVKELVEDKSLISDYVVDNSVSPNMMERLRQIVLDLKNS